MRMDLGGRTGATLAIDLPLEMLEGQIHLERDRMLLVHARALGLLRRELIDTVGLMRARGILMRMGFASGRQDAELARRLLPHASDEEVLRLGPVLHSLEGFAKVVPVSIAMDFAAGQFEMEALWEDSQEAASHVEMHGHHHEPVCWTKQGYACGFVSELMGRRVIFREVECRGRGDAVCRVIGKPLERWNGEADADDRLLAPERVADQLSALQEQLGVLRETLGAERTNEMVLGSSQAFRAAFALAEKVAASSSTVLLLGETGVGKEMFARHLHARSARARGPFVAVNCGALPEPLVESELFGVEKGAYTGADRSRPGKFERAHGGTLFLDEIGELSAAAQVKLLRVVQSGEFERVGDARSRRADVRVVAATNRDLQAEVRAQRFRADLYFRLNSFPITLPPLRERREDIPLLAEHLMRKVAARDGKPIAGIAPEAMRRLVAHDWPGNVRELENVLEYGVILAEPGGLMEVVRVGESAAGASAAPPEPARAAVEASLVERLAQSAIGLDALEESFIEAALRRHDGNLTRTAKALGITRRQLAYRRKRG